MHIGLGCRKMRPIATVDADPEIIECERCHSTDSLIVYDIMKNCESDDDDNENAIILCKNCYAKMIKENAKSSKQFVGISTIKEGVTLILKGLQEEFGLDINDDNFKDTPNRVARAYYELCLGINCQEEVYEILNKSFSTTYDGMVVSKGIRCYSLCPHHLLPVEYIVDVGYIPDHVAIGISKIPRIVKLLAKAPKLQEQFTADVAEVLESIDCKGVIIQVRGKHMCMGMRGVKQPEVVTMTSEIRGIFKQPEVRNEFQLLIKGDE
jgi:GTP cyclohydrolase IA